MLTTNYYNMKYNMRLYKQAYIGGSYDSVQDPYLLFDDIKQLHYVNGNYETGNRSMYCGTDILFDVIPYETIYETKGSASGYNFAIGFDGSDTPATIDDFKLIEPISNCSIISTAYNKIDNTIIREITIKNNNNTEIIIKGVGLFGNFGMYKKSLFQNLPLLYREVFTSPITVSAGSSFIYRLETTEGE